jgi:hypothetical protein
MVEYTERHEKRLLEEKARFTGDNPQATSVLAGDFNAAESEYLDTDRDGATHDSGKMEPDEAVIRTLRSMKYDDLIRVRFPNKRVVTRVVSHQTNRLLDRIMTTKEVAGNAETRIAVSKRGFLKAGSDHVAVIADLPVDTAGTADTRVPIWEPYEYERWGPKEFKTPEEKEEAEKNYNIELEATRGEIADDIEWLSSASKKHLLKPTTMVYPKKPKHRKHYTKEDWKAYENLQSIRGFRLRTLADAMEGQCINEKSARKAQKRIVECEPLGHTACQKLWELAKGQDLSAIVGECAVLIEALEQHLSGKERCDRAKTMRQNLKVRKQRFQDSDKKMLKLVINSIMQKYSPQQNLTSAESEGGMKYSEVDVAKAIAKFFEEWMGSRVGVQKWWGTEGGTAEDAWETMMDMDVSNIQDPDIREFVETAYLRSHRHFEGGTTNGRAVKVEGSTKRKNRGVVPWWLNDPRHEAAERISYEEDWEPPPGMKEQYVNGDEDRRCAFEAAVKTTVRQNGL